MPVLDNLSPHIDVDAILRGQGADPDRLRARGSGALAVAEQALAEGLPLLQPAVAYERVEVTAFRHRQLLFGRGGAGRLSGPLIASHLHSASEVVAIVCTIGPLLEERSASWMGTDAPRALALDALGSIAVEQLATLAGDVLERAAAADGLCTTIPLSPGLIGWPLQTGHNSSSPSSTPHRSE